jgi:hypothetical protein
MSAMEKFLRLIQRCEDGCWIWCGPKLPAGYGKLHFGGKSYYTHRYSYEAFKGVIPQGHYVCHACDNPACCNPEHLFTGTQRDNMTDCAAKGRVHRRIGDWAGSLNPKSKLTEYARQKIVDALLAGENGTKIAEQFGVSKVRVSQIRREAGVARAKIGRPVGSRNKGSARS